MTIGHFWHKVMSVKGMKPTSMDKISKVIVKYRNWILLIATLLLIPSAIGYFNTRINYDILSYLPADKISMKAQDVLNDDFNLGGTAMVVLNDTPDQEVQALKRTDRRNTWRRQNIMENGSCGLRCSDRGSSIPSSGYSLSGWIDDDYRNLHKPIRIR